jgi:hypothetical protein
MKPSDMKNDPSKAEDLLEKLKAAKAPTKAYANTGQVKSGESHYESNNSKGEKF